MVVRAQSESLPGWRVAGRRLRRQVIEWKRTLAKGPARHRANSELNWREFWHGQTVLKSFPRKIQVGTNWTCNLKCTFCRLTQESTQERLRPMPMKEREISDRVYETLMGILPYVETFQLTPLGEPLLWSRLPEVLEFCARERTGNLALTTNGMLLTEEKAEMLVRAGLDLMFVSIDSSDPETYAAMRVGGKLEKVEAGLERVNRWKEKLHSTRPCLVMASTFMRSNIEHLPAMVDFAKRHRFDELSVQLMEIENPDQAPEFLGKHIDLTREMVEKAMRRGEETGQRVNIHLALKNLLTSRGMDLQDSPSMKSISTRHMTLIDKCHYPWYYLLVDTDGDVRPCCWASTSWGNLNRDDFQSVWNGELAQTMRRNFLRDHIPASCRGKHCRVDL